jgi:hypothetical protein
MKPSINYICVLLVLLPGMEISAQTPGGRTAAATGAFPRLEPDPRALEFARRGARGGEYTWTELAEISLWASSEETSAQALSSYRELIRAAAAELKSSPELPGSSREQAEYILTFMHKKFLKSYSLYQTRVDTLLSSGRYNCVSSAVLYMILARSAGLNVSGAMTRDHAFAVVKINGESIDVETTNPYGFDPGSRREFHDQFGKLTGFAYVPARNYRDRAAISPIELVSLILSNRISDLESRNRFADAVPLAIDRAALLMGEKYAERPVSAGSEGAAPFFEEPRRDMMNRIFNFGAFLLKSGKEEECLRWAASASPKYPEEKRWQEFIMAAANNNLQKLVKAGHIGSARAFLNSQKPALNAENFGLLDSMLVDMELLGGASRIQSVNEGNAVLAAIEQARSSKRINPDRAAELFTFTVQKAASIISAAPGRDWLGAINYIEGVIARYGSTKELDQSLRNYRTNRAADYHNRFAAAWNSLNFAEAEQIVNAGLTELPDNRQLLADKQILDKNRGGQ